MVIKYKPPKIQGVVLDLDQAVIAVCKVGGKYLTRADGNCVGTELGSPNEDCLVSGSVRGQWTLGPSFTTEVAAAPS